MRVLLSEADFQNLVAGKVVTAQSSDNATVEIALSDIGYERMMTIILDYVKASTSRRTLISGNR